MTPEEIAELRTSWVGRAFWNDGFPDCELPVWVVQDVVLEGESVLVRFYAEGSSGVFGIRFANEPLPVAALMWDEDVATTTDWFMDRRIAIGVALDTGLLERAVRRPQLGWTELVVDPDVEGWVWEEDPPRHGRAPVAAFLRRFRRGKA